MTRLALLFATLVATLITPLVTPLVTPLAGPASAAQICRAEINAIAPPPCGNV